MIPEEIYKRRHFGTPESVSLIVVNYIVTIIAIQAFAMCTHIRWLFWVIIGLLAIYNFYQIRKNREVFDRKNLIVFSISLILLLAVFFLLRTRAQPC
jgi:4-hydroxybenzoate polyprenyltransferase